jgi:ABC-type transporter Mla subunit MlaD
MTEQKEWEAEIRTFLESLSDHGKEIVQTTLSDWVSECCEAKLKHIEDNLRELKAEIDRVNRKREYLSTQLTASSEAVDLLDKFLEANKDSLVLSLLKDVVATRSMDLRREIHVLKPEHKLKKKAEFRCEKEVLLRRRDIALKILEALKGEKK